MNAGNSEWTSLNAATLESHRDRRAMAPTMTRRRKRVDHAGDVASKRGLAKRNTVSNVSLANDKALAARLCVPQTTRRRIRIWGSRRRPLPAPVSGPKSPICSGRQVHRIAGACGVAAPCRIAAAPHVDRCGLALRSTWARCGVAAKLTSGRFWGGVLHPTSPRQYDRERQDMSCMRRAICRGDRLRRRASATIRA